MNARAAISFAFVGGLLCWTGCGVDGESLPAGGQLVELTKPIAVAPEALRNRMLQIARDYESFELVDYRMRVTAIICDFSPSRLVRGTNADTIASVSRSKDSSTHGRKQYLVFATTGRPGSSLDLSRKLHPTGQIVVKEAWIPEEIPKSVATDEPIRRTLPPALGRSTGKRTISIVPHDSIGEHHYQAGAKSGLFVMLKLDPRTPETDEGWVYGTVTPDGKQVNSAGLIQSCVKCHSHAPHDRVFGPPTADQFNGLSPMVPDP